MTFSLVLLLNRVALGLYFLLAGLDKIRGGVTNFVEGIYAETTPAWLPAWFATPYGYGLPYVEVIVGAALILGWFSRLAACLMWLILSSIIIAIGVRHPDMPFHPNAIYLVVAFTLMLMGPGGLSMDALWNKDVRINKRLVAEAVS